MPPNAQISYQLVSENIIVQRRVLGLEFSDENTALDYLDQPQWYPQSISRDDPRVNIHGRTVLLKPLYLSDSDQ